MNLLQKAFEMTFDKDLNVSFSVKRINDLPKYQYNIIGYEEEYNKLVSRLSDLSLSKGEREEVEDELEEYEEYEEVDFENIEFYSITEECIKMTACGDWQEETYLDLIHDGEGIKCIYHSLNFYNKLKYKEQLSEIDVYNAYNKK